MLDPGCFRELLATIDASLARVDLEAHLMALVFSSRVRAADGGPDALVEQCRSALAANAASGTPYGPQDIAVTGVRMALGYPTAVPAAMTDLLRKELSREPLPPAACAKDDEQILIGVAAGIGAAGAPLGGALASLIHGRGASRTFRQGAIDLWAQSLACGSVHLSQESAATIYEYIIQRRESRRGGASEDDVVALWLSTRLLDAPWTPTDTQIQQIGAAQNTLRRTVIAGVARQEFQSGLDAAFAFDGIVSSLNASLARPSTLEQILAVIEAFPSSAEVLRHRQRGRKGFEIDDEYDVQDLFRALILPVVRDLVPEDPASKVAGRSSRLDFVSRKQRTGFEVKHLKSPADRDRVREEVLLDERVYQAHPYIETVVVFIADPSVHLPLADREPFEADLSQTVTVGDRTVRYVVRVR